MCGFGRALAPTTVANAVNVHNVKGRVVAQGSLEATTTTITTMTTPTTNNLSVVSMSVNERTREIVEVATTQTPTTMTLTAASSVDHSSEITTGAGSVQSMRLLVLTFVPKL